MQDRRKMPRLRALKSARIDMHSRWPTIECTLRNLSAKGAGLEISGGFNTSLEYDLVLLSSRQTRACRQVWRDGDRIGVVFT